MKAVRILEHGGLDVIRYDDVPVPFCEPNGVLVKMKAAAVNHLDLWVRQGMPGVKTPLPLILGCDMAGEIVEVGSKVTHLKVGDAIMAQPGLSCGHCIPCLRGDDNVCNEYGILGETCDGTFAEVVAMPAVNVIPKPANLSWEQAAAVPLVFLTAWHMLVAKAKIRPGQDLLVLAAGSGIGTAAIQIGKLFGATVYAAAGSEAKLSKAKDLGADHTINYNETDFAKEVWKLTDKKGADVVFENIGADTWDKSLQVLARNGKVVFCGATSGPKVSLNLAYLFWHHLEILGSTMGSKAELLEVAQHMATGRLKPVVDQVFPLSEAARAQKRMMDREQFGKLILVPDNE